MVSERHTDSGGHAGYEEYARLSEYADQLREELSEILAPVLEVTDAYGALICRVTGVLGSSPPASTQDIVFRDLMADVFDFLLEWRRPLLEGRIQVAYPLARRSYESLSLLSVCAQDVNFAGRWEQGKQISNAEIREALAAAPMAESAEGLRDLYKFFSLGSHPNRELVAYRYLGEGNEFVLGAIGAPDLVFVVDHCIRLIQMWFWFAATVVYSCRAEIQKADGTIADDYMATAAKAQEVIHWLIANLTKLLEERQSRKAQ